MKPQPSPADVTQPARTRPGMSFLLWLIFGLALVALTFAPRWLPWTERDAVVTMTFAPDASKRIESWLDDQPLLRSSPALNRRSVEQKSDALRITFERPNLNPLVIELRALEEGHRGIANSDYFAFYIVGPNQDQQTLLPIARELAKRDDGSLLSERKQIPIANVPSSYGWLGLAPALAALLLLLRDRFRLPSAGNAIVKRTHLIPIGLQLSFFIYWGLYWPRVWNHVPSVVAQLLFAYVLDVLLAWWLRRPWPAIFAVGAPVLSANLFVWFSETSLWVSFLIIGVALTSKALVRRQDGHIFNPSALGTAIIALAAISWPQLFHHTDLGKAISTPANMSEIMFLATLIPLGLLGTSFIPIGAALALVILQIFVGEGPTFTWPGWFLAITIFAGDPATVPRSALGRFLYGVMVGVSLQVSAMILLAMTGADFWAKVLAIPLANLAAPWLDRTAHTLSQRWGHLIAKDSSLPPWRRRVRWLVERPMLLWIALFLIAFIPDKSGGFSREFHESWGTPTVHLNEEGRADCALNPAFCTPFRFDLEIAAWLRK